MIQMFKWLNKLQYVADVDALTEYSLFLVSTRQFHFDNALHIQIFMLF